MRKEHEFYTKTWMTRFLRVIRNIRINSGKQDLSEFIDCANRETGLSRSMVYFQVFPAYQGIGPGYASTFASSQGFTPRTIFQSRLQEHIGT